MVDRGIARFRNAWNSDRAGGDTGRQRAVKELISTQIEPMYDLLLDTVAKAASGRPGRRNATLMALNEVEPEVAAFLTAKYVLNGIICNQAYGTIQRELGGAIEDEIRINKLAEHDQTAIDWVERECKRRKITKRHHRRAYFVRMEKLRAAPHRPWKSADKIKIGATLVELFCEATRIVKVTHKRTGKKTKAVLTPVPQILHWVTARNDQLELLKPDFLPMVVPPKAWKDGVGGGYLTHSVPLVKGLDQDERAGHAQALSQADIKPVFKALRAMDQTGYVINREVLDVMQALNDRGEVIPGLEGTEMMEVPEKPSDIATNEDARRDYSKQARNAHDHNASAISLRMTFERTLALAERFKNEQAVYFPSQLDFRGRVYPMPATLNPQGPDFARALLLFNVSKPLGQKGMDWLKVNLANLFGEDKVSLEDRILWADQHKAELLAVAHNPLEERWWMEADKPWQFLAACLDYKMAREYGVSCVRVSMDGSCNGIQHFAAMLLDPVAARAVNLAISDIPRDIYQDVADVVIGRLKGERDPQKRYWADTLLALGIDRKITKRSVMVMPYGGTFHSTRKYVEQECMDRGYHESFGDDWNEVSTYLAQLVHQGTRTVVKSGAEVMSWLQEVAKIASTSKTHLRWKTPTGFVAEQHYLKYDGVNIKTKLDGKIARSTWDYVKTDRIDPVRSRNGISPNYVHSMDAAAMMMAVNLGAGDGLTHFHCIHDDFGTHAADTQHLFECLREAFVCIYREDQLRILYRQFQALLPTDFIPEPPTRGEFNIYDVMASKYFFA